jgi:hypothetical protein
MIEVSDRGKLRNRIFIALGVVLLLVAGGSAVFFYSQWKKLNDDPSAVSKATTDRLKGEVGKIYALPNDEEPTVAKIEDKEKLKDQTFFAKAENGDYILIYTKAKLALLYRDKERKLMNVGPITISDTSQTQAPATAGATDTATNKDSTKK